MSLLQVYQPNFTISWRLPFQMPKQKRLKRKAIAKFSHHATQNGVKIKATESGALNCLEGLSEIGSVFLENCLCLDKMKDAPALKIMETQFPDTMAATKK